MLKKDKKKRDPASLFPVVVSRENNQMLNYTVSDVTNKVNPYDIKLSKNALIKINEEFCATFYDTFTHRINAKGFQRYKAPLEECMEYIYLEELHGLVMSGDKKVNISDYKKFNEKIAFAFHNRLSKKTWRYGGYSVLQIVQEIKDAAGEFESDKKKATDSLTPYRIPALSRRIEKKISLVFAEYRKKLRDNYLKKLDINRYSPLVPKYNYNHADPVLRTNAVAQCVCHMPVKESARYLSFPIADGSYICATDQNTNLLALLLPMLEGYGQNGGYSAFVQAGTGTGKTYAMVEKVAPFLGELCNCPVHMLMPTRPQLGQMRGKYECDVNYSEEHFEKEGYNPNLRVHVYDCVDSISAIVKDEITGAFRPVIMIIDEAHSLLTEKYRGRTLKKITRKAKEILSAGGIVIAMSASSEMISATMPYNQLSGYDMICNIFRVSSMNVLMADGRKTAYPSYSYADAAKYGKASGIEIMNAIPSRKIRVCYQNAQDRNMSSSLIMLIMDYLKKGHKVIAEYNDTDQLMEIRNMLAKKGYTAVVCHANDKDYDPDEKTKGKTYRNKVYNSIINDNSIDFSDTDVVLTTKLLENGTTIDNLTASGLSEQALADMKDKAVTIFAVDRRTVLNLEAFDQFSGRLRFMHGEAVLLCRQPGEGANVKYKPDVAYYMRKGMYRVASLADKLKSGLVSLSRLHYIDFNANEDMPEGLNGDGDIDASAVSEAMYRAVRNYYKAMSYNRQFLEDAVKERYSTKEVTFEILGKSSIEIEELHAAVSKEGSEKIRKAIKEAFSDPEVREAFKSGYDRNKDGKKKRSLPVLHEMGENSRAAYIEPVRESVSVVFSLQDISKHIETESAMKGKPEKVLPETLTGEAFEKNVSAAIDADTKRAANALNNESLAAGFDFLKRYKGLSEPLRNYALKYGDRLHGLDFDDFIAECSAALPAMDKELKPMVVTLMKTLFDSDKKKRIDRLVYVCPSIACVDMEFYARMSRYTASEIDQITSDYQAVSYVLVPGLLHAEDTASGATFACITGKAAYAISCGEAPDDFSIASWENKIINKERAGKIYEVYKAYMSKNGFPYDSSPETGRLKILRLFASAFTFTQGISKDGDVFITLGALRKRRPMDFDQIAHLNFRGVVRRGSGTFLLKFKNEGNDNLDDCRETIITDPFAMKCVEIKDAFLSECRERFWRVIVFNEGNKVGFKTSKIVGSVECTEGGAVLSSEIKGGVPGIRYVNGYGGGSDYSKGRIGYALLNEWQYRELYLKDPSPTAESVYRIACTERPAA